VLDARAHALLKPRPACLQPDTNATAFVAVYKRWAAVAGEWGKMMSGFIGRMRMSSRFHI